MELIRLSVLDYYLLDKSWRTGLSDYYVSDISRSMVYGLTDDEGVCAYAVIVSQEPLPVLEFVFTVPQRRRRGLAYRLIRMIADTVNSDIQCHLLSSFPSYTEMNGLLNKLGASSSCVGRVYTSAVNARLWERMDEMRMVRLKDMILRGGGECSSLAEADPSVIKQLADSPFSAFRNHLDPRALLDNPHLDKTFSSVYLRDSRLCAYTLLTGQNGGSICFEQISESEDMIGKGAVMAPLCLSLEALRAATPEISRFSLQINKDNRDSYSFVMSILKDQDLSITDNYIYRIRHIKTR